MIDRKATGRGRRGGDRSRVAHRRRGHWHRRAGDRRRPDHRTQPAPDPSDRSPRRLPSSRPRPRRGRARPPGPLRRRGRRAASSFASSSPTRNRPGRGSSSEHGRRYPLPKLVLFDGSVNSGCGMTSAAVGPFYCPQDFKVYLDLSFFREIVPALRRFRRFRPGLRDRARSRPPRSERARHHGPGRGRPAGFDRDRAPGRLPRRASGAIAEDRKGLLEPGDVEEGLKAAAAVGDDALQKMETGHVQPESWTHGSSADRVASLQRGLSSGDPESCRMPGASEPLFR